MSSVKLTPLSASLLLAVVAIAWGAIPLFVRNDVPAAGLVGVRVTLGAAALIAFAVTTRRLRFPHTERWRVVACGVLLTAHWVTFFAAVKLTTVAIALAVMYLGPIAAAVLSGPVLGERVSPRLWSALAIAAGGTVLVVQPWAIGQGDTSSIEGVAIALLSGALLTALMIIAKPASEQLGGLTLSIGELTVAAIILTPATVNAFTEYPEQLPAFLVLGIVFTGVANVTYWEIYRVIPVAVVSTIMYLDPASAVLWAFVFLDETPNLLTWMGILLVVAGGVVAAAAARDKEAVVGQPHLSGQ